MISALDVIWIKDNDIDPPASKMVVCLCPKMLLFFRINTYNEYPIPVAIPKEPNHKFFKWDSYIECSEQPIELDEYTVSESIRKSGGKPLGKISPKHTKEICSVVQLRKTIAKELKSAIFSALGYKP